MTKKNKMIVKHSLHLPQKLYNPFTVQEYFFDLLHRRRSRIELPDFLVPQIDVHEGASTLTLEIEIPGMELGDISLKVDRDIIHIRGEKRRTIVRNEGTYTRMERKYGVFSRVLRLPAEVDAQRVNTSYSNGIFTLTLTKAQALDIHDSG